MNVKAKIDILQQRSVDFIYSPFTIDPAIFTVSELVDLYYNTELYDTVAVCNNEATISVNSDLNKFVIIKTKKIEDYLEGEY